MGNRKRGKDGGTKIKAEIWSKEGAIGSTTTFEKAASLRRNYTTVFERKTLRTKGRSEETQNQRSNKTNSFKPRLQNIGLLGNKVFWCFHPVYLVAEWLSCIKDVVVIFSLCIFVQSCGYG